MVLLPPVGKRARLCLGIRTSIERGDEQSAPIVEPPHLGVFGVGTRVPSRSRVAPGLDAEPIAFPPHRLASPFTVERRIRAASDDAGDRAPLRTDVIRLGT